MSALNDKILKSIADHRRPADLLTREAKIQHLRQIRKWTVGGSIGFAIGLVLIVLGLFKLRSSVSPGDVILTFAGLMLMMSTLYRMAEHRTEMLIKFLIKESEIETK